MRTDSAEKTRSERIAQVATLAAGLAHEIRNPLNSAALQLKVLENRLSRCRAGATQLEILDIVRNELGRIEDLVSDFLAFAEPLVLEIAPLELNGLLDELARLFAAPAEHIGVKIELALDPDLGEVAVDAARLGQVMTNLIENAFDAMPDGGTVTIRSHARDADGFVRIVVEDTGVGFPKDAPVFDAFYSTKAQGTGLGLPIANRIVSDHGGKLLCEPGSGGTRFTLLLPARRGS